MRNRTIISVSLATALMVAAATAWAQGSQAAAQGKPDKAAQAFISKAIEGNLAEVSMGQLAQQNAGSDEVRQFGQQLVADHTAGAQKATSVANQLGVTPPTTPNKKQVADHHRLMKFSGAAFDRAFTQHMVADHRKEIAEHRKAAKMKNEAAASYATATLPVLQKHLEMAQALAKSSAGSARGGAKGGGRSM